MPPSWLLGSKLLRLAEQVRRDGCVGREASEVIGDGECPPEETPGRIDARERGDARSAAKKVVSAPARREVVTWMRSKGLSERRALTIVKMSASSLRYQPAPDRNIELRQRIVTLAQRHRRYGAGMIYLKLRQAGERVNHKRVERLYAEEKLQIKRRRRKKVPISERQPLLRPQGANEVWSMDFVYDRVAGGRMLKILGIVDDGTHECVAAHVEHTIGGDHLVRVLDQLCASRGYPKIIRTDNAKEFTGRAMLTWAHERGVVLRLIEPGKPNQNAYIESFNSRFRDECLNEHWFLNLRHARSLIRAWRRGIQRGTSEERAGWPDAVGIREEIGYSHCRTLGRSATQKGVTPRLTHPLISRTMRRRQ